MDQPVYKRILLKLSGEALAPANREDGILDFPFIDKVAAVLKKCREAGVEIGVIVGAGNIWRGRWIGAAQTIWECWQQPSTRWRCRTVFSTRV